MSKFKRLNLRESMELFPLMNEETRKALKGGCSLCDQFPGQIYSEEEYKRMDAAGDWTGGLVCGMGYVGPTTDIWGDRDYCFNHGVYTDEEDCMGCYYEQFEFCDEHDRYFDRLESCDECMWELYENEDYYQEYIPYEETDEDEDDVIIPGSTTTTDTIPGQLPNINGQDNGNSQDSTQHNPQDNKPVIKNDVSLMDVYKFSGYSATGDCLLGAKRIMDKYKCDHGNSAEVFQLGIGDEDKNFVYYGDNPSENYQNAVDCIDRHLDSGKPIIVGVDYGTGSPNTDNTTDHFVVIVGRGYDKEKGMYYYTFMETATDNSAIGCNEKNNRFYYDPQDLSLVCTTDSMYPDGMRVTQVRPNDGKSKGKTIDSNIFKR